LADATGGDAGVFFGPAVGEAKEGGLAEGAASERVDGVGVEGSKASHAGEASGVFADVWTWGGGADDLGVVNGGAFFAEFFGGGGGLRGGGGGAGVVFGADLGDGVGGGFGGVFDGFCKLLGSSGDGCGVGFSRGD